jgi:hypothetical protein
MPEIVANPLYMKDSVFAVAQDDFAAELSSVAFTPSSSVATWKGLKPTSVFTDVSAPTWTCEITFSQNWDDDDSLAVYLFQNVGERKVVTFQPKGGGRAFTATIIITPGAIGGAVDAFASASVTLGVAGQPALGAVIPAA